MGEYEGGNGTDRRTEDEQFLLKLSFLYSLCSYIGIIESFKDNTDIANFEPFHYIEKVAEKMNPVAIILALNHQLDYSFF